MAYLVNNEAALLNKSNALLCAEFKNDDSSWPPCFVPSHLFNSNGFYGFYKFY